MVLLDIVVDEDGYPWVELFAHEDRVRWVTIIKLAQETRDQSILSKSSEQKHRRPNDPEKRELQQEPETYAHITQSPKSFGPPTTCFDHYGRLLKRLSALCHLEAEASRTTPSLCSTFLRNTRYLRPLCLPLQLRLMVWHDNWKFV